MAGHGFPYHPSAALALILLACACGAGCTMTRTMPPTRVQTELIGMAREGVIRCAGAPASETTTGGETVLLYNQKATAMERYFSARGGASSLPRNCEARVVLKDGRVTSVEYSPVPETKDACEECDDIFAGCLR